LSSKRKEEKEERKKEKYKCDKGYIGKVNTYLNIS